MTRVLVTGATGFIGRRLVKALREVGTKVLALSRGSEAWGDEGVASIAADLTEASAIENVCAGVDGVFHLAGYAHAGDANDERAAGIHRQLTVGGTFALLREACRAGVKRFVFVSSVKAMGEGSEDDCIDETAPALPASEYGRAKLEAEQLVLSCNRDHGMHACVLRLPLVYGPGVKGNLHSMIKAIDYGRFPPLPKVANKRSLVHVDDVVRALLVSLKNPAAKGEVFILTDGRIYSTYDIYISIRRALGKTPATWAMPLSMLRMIAHIGDTVGYIRARPFFFDSETLNKLLGSACYSSKKIEQRLGFEPSQTLEAALPEIINSYRLGAARLN